MKKIVLGSDHAGFELKEKIKKHLGEVYEIIDVGTNSNDSVDYPDFGKAAAEAIASGKAELGVVVCGSGIGISIAANRNPKIRCALCTTDEMARLSRQHNNANMLALGARIVPEPINIGILEAFLATEFEGGRHAKRVEKLSD